MFTTFAGGWPSLVLWMFHCSWHSSVVLGEACALDVNTFLLQRPPLMLVGTAAPARLPTPQFDYQRRQRGAVTDPRSTG